MQGTRVVVPRPGREAVLAELHEGHPGIARMKSLARMYMCGGRELRRTLRKLFEDVPSVR